MADVPLVDLEVILRYSLAIRQETADARDVLEALDQSRAHVLQLLRAEHGGSAQEAEASQVEENEEDDAVGDESNGEGDAGAAASAADGAAPPPKPRRQALRPRRAQTGNGEVDLENLPSPLPKEEAAARRAARRARRTK